MKINVTLQSSFYRNPSKYVNCRVTHNFRLLHTMALL